jgi:copper chaperone NosL
MTPKTFIMTVIALTAAATALPVHAADTLRLPDGNKLDLGTACPVCSMKTGGGQIGPAALVLKDGKVVGFDGPGDLFRYILQPGKFGVNSADIKNVFVTDYKTKKLMDAKEAVYVLGSEIMTDMGLEAVPFESKESAEEFKTSHKGKIIAPFSDVEFVALASPKKMLKMRHGEGGSKSGH